MNFERSKCGFCLVVAVAFSFCWGLVANAEIHKNVAIVDVQKAIENCEAVKKVTEVLEGKEKAYEQEFAKIHENLEKEKMRITSLGSSLSEKQMRERKSAFDQKVSLLNKKVQDSRAKLQKAYQGVLLLLNDKVSGILKEMGQKQDLSIIMEKSAILWFNDKSVKDITQEVVGKLNEVLPTIPVKLDEK
ncbi:OmpH family outer membrane protein [Candidatus Hydrogenosomobacter endosymbioticus]|uniref:Outer membrane chaperone Skp n=1 Tax=Candidatus Hydrogenosomobacter endosymbioticus TaxID=2558174 RepID=A0ABM7V9Q6_9PROT|nr:OmpH family outer membrane protein [Candidatus Hydrogenosomobacter endosymbioticus]BDB96245.1 hypothetical protein HYD_3780 [Candidatus Hydrogenosomobacter endosymbioticus]